MAESCQLPEAQPVRTPAAIIMARIGRIPFVIASAEIAQCIVLGVGMAAEELVDHGGVSP
jgi:hypothetical protein